MSVVAQLEVWATQTGSPTVAYEQTARQALAEMRRMLGLLRADEDGASLAPQPGMDQVGSLIEHVGAAGLTVELAVSGEPRALPPGLELADYRILQEGLTNVLRHAGPARTRVAVRYGDREIELEVADDGCGLSPDRNGAGHGIIGMRERAALYGGSLATGPASGGGFVVRAVLPIPSAYHPRRHRRRSGHGAGGLSLLAQPGAWQATRRLAAMQSSTRILILTTFDLDEYVYDGLRAGASGFLLKDVSPEQLIAAIHVIDEGEAVLAPSVTRRVVEAFSRFPARQDHLTAALAKLTAREREVLELLAKGSSNLEVAHALIVSETTAKTHVRNVLAKLDLRDRVHAVVFAYESGLVRPGGP